MFKWLKDLFKEDDKESWGSVKDDLINIGVAPLKPWPRGSVPMKPTPPPPVPNPAGKPIGTPNYKRAISDLPVATDIARPLSPAGAALLSDLYLASKVAMALSPRKLSKEDIEETLWVIVRDERTQLDYKTKVIDLVKATLSKLEDECQTTKNV